MRTIYKLLTLILLIVFAGNLSAQQSATRGKNKNKKPQTTFSRKTIEGKEYYFYRIEEEDVIDSICVKFDVTPDVITQYNPEIIDDTLAVGHLLIIPVRYNTAQIASAEKMFNHIVAAGETLYSLSRMYGVSINRITALNPGAEEVIHIGDTLRIPQNAVVGNPIQSQDAHIYHTIAAGETLYSLSKRYHTSVAEILKQNPGLDPQKLGVGEVIRIASDNKELQPAPKVETFNYTVKSKKETLESVAKKFGVTPEEILAVNDGKDRVQRGNTIAIPRKSKKETVREEIVQITKRKEKAAGEPFNIAIILPFMNNKPQDVRSTLYTEFYQGFLFAADSMKRRGLSLNIYALDTRGSSATIDSIVKTLPEKDLDLIIGPVENEDIERVAGFAREHDINMVNPFSVKSTEAEKNIKVFQCNIPHENLYSRSRDKIIAEIGDRYVVFVIDDSGKENGKLDHLNRIKTKLLQQERDFLEISLGQDPYMETFEDMAPGVRDVFVLTNASSRSSVGKVLAPLTKLKEEKSHINITLYGYPEWQVYTKEYINQFHRLNTTIFSRFYTLPGDSAAMQLQDKFLYWYHRDMLQANPQHVVLGYDTGIFFLEAMAQYGRNFDKEIEALSYPGIQTGYKFRRINNWSGFNNSNIYFVRFTPKLEIEREILPE